MSRTAPTPAILLYVLALTGVTSEMRTAATPLDHFAWSTVASPQSTGTPFSAVLTANDNAGNLVSNYSGNVSVSTEILSVPPLVISEVDNGTTNQVEFTNPSTNSVDVSGWQVAFYDFSKWPQPAMVFTIPAGTVCPPQSVFVIAAGGVAPGAFPRFFLGTALRWGRISDPVAVSLLNRTNGLVDFFCASTGYPYLVTNPVPVLPGGWFGAPVALNANLNYTYQRQGDFDDGEALDWIATNRSIGTLNLGLSLPFAPNYMPVGVSPGSIYLTNGVWSGWLLVVAGGSNVVLQADDGSGNPGTSNPFNVVNGAAVELLLPAQTSDASPGVQVASISIPAAIGADLVFNLQSSDPAKVEVPATVVIPAGITSAPFEVTNFDDPVVDGIQLVAITASNYLFPSAQGVITNFSTPVPLELEVPSQAGQQPGAILGQAQLSTSVPVTSNFQAEIASSDPSLLATPSFVQIAAGQTNVTFNLLSPAGPEIVGSRDVSVTAFAGTGAAASASITIIGQPTNLTLVLPAELVEGAGTVSNAVITIAGILPTNVSVSLSSSDPATLEVPATVMLPAGQTSALVSLTVPSNSGPGPDVPVTVSASAPGFADASGSITIQDNHLDHFAFEGIPLGQTANQAFTVSIVAENQSGDILESYSGSASLFPLGVPSGSLVPTQTGNFTNGLWSGTATISVAGTNVILGAQNGSASGQSNPFNVAPVFVSTLNATVGGLVYDPGTDRIYGTIPAAAGAESNTVMRLNPYAGTVEAYIPVDINPGLMTLSASNQYIYIAVQSGASVERLNLASQTPDLEFAVPQSFFGNWVGNMMGLPDSPASVAIFGQSTGITQDYIFDGDVESTNLTDLALAPG
ncbi:MAG: lamin tail domain-containing protein, partial [Verrucomicrobiota bacterium]